MKTIIAGSRTIEDYGVVEAAVEASGFDITEVVSGCARGVDRLGERWAETHQLPIARFPADWKHYGRRAGPIRNNEMVGYAQALIAVWDGTSNGTHHIINAARREGRRVFVYHVKGQTNGNQDHADHHTGHGVSGA